MEHYSTPFFRLAKTRHIIAIHPPEAIADGVSLEICRAFASDGNAVMEHYSTPFFRLAKTRHISAIHPPEPMAAHLICRASASDADSVTDVQSAPSSLPCKNTDYQRDPSTGSDSRWRLT